MADLEDGETIEVQGSGKKPYELKNTGGVYSCTCPAWRNQSLGIEQRTCKHLRKLRGDEAEKERVGSALPPPRKSKEAKAGPPILLAHRWENDVELDGWWMSEKLDGVRAYWDGTQFLSRQGNVYHAPDWFTAGLPESPLDGELWLDRKAFQKTVSIVRRQDKSDHWKKIRYVVFDAPSVQSPFEERIAYLDDYIQSSKNEYIESLAQQRCRDLVHLREELARVESLGGEGLMLRQPASSYAVGRSVTLLKVKTFHDSEAVVLDHIPGKGRHKGRMGALSVQLSDGTEFSVGTGFSDKQRETPPEIGSTITFRYQELSDGGVPRFPSFVRPHSGAAKASAPASSPTAETAKTAVKKPAKKATKKAVKKTAKKPEEEPAPPAVANVRHFEFVDAKSSKFWEISHSALDVTVRYGRIGTDGRATTKSFATEEAAIAHAEKLIDQKTSKGYEETA